MWIYKVRYVSGIGKDTVEEFWGAHAYNDAVQRASFLRSQFNLEVQVLRVWEDKVSQ